MSEPNDEPDDGMDEDLDEGEVPAEVRSRLVLALDVDDIVAARRLAFDLEPFFGTVKVGLELFCATGTDTVSGFVAGMEPCEDGSHRSDRGAYWDDLEVVGYVEKIAVEVDCDDDVRARAKREDEPWVMLL